jgi:hypothetical protein
LLVRQGKRRLKSSPEGGVMVRCGIPAHTKDVKIANELNWMLESASLVADF